MRHSREFQTPGLLRAACGAFALPAAISLCLADTAMSNEETPKDVYIRYHQVLLKANSLDAVVPFYCKRAADEIRKAPKEQKSMIFELMTGMEPKTVKVLSEDIKGDHAVLELAGVYPVTSPDAPSLEDVVKKAHAAGQKYNGVNFVRENGVWKLKGEEWTSKD